jgi:hypothetical protein
MSRSGQRELHLAFIILSQFSSPPYSYSCSWLLLREFVRKAEQQAKEAAENPSEELFAKVQDTAVSYYRARQVGRPGLVHADKPLIPACNPYATDHDQTRLPGRP